MTTPAHLEIVRLVGRHRWAALATSNDGSPLASMVAYAPERGLEGLLLFLSRLSLHTRNLLADPRASLAIGDPDPGVGDPQTVPRVSLQGKAVVVPRNAGAFRDAWDVYVARFPDAAPRVDLLDFDLFRLRVDDVRYVGGFARAVRMTGDDLREAAQRG